MKRGKFVRGRAIPSALYTVNIGLHDAWALEVEKGVGMVCIPVVRVVPNPLPVESGA